jgi:hypothetical protein
MNLNFISYYSKAGIQFEILMGGHVEAGFHEVVVSPNTSAIIEKRLAEGKSLWRVSSTLFSHIQSDQILQPLGQYATPESTAKYLPKMAGQQVN